MLGDRFFYPLAGLIIAGMIALALSFGGGPSVTDQDIIDRGINLTGPDLVALTISPGSNGTYVDEEGGFMRLSQFTPRGEGPASIGWFLSLGPDYERAFSGRMLRITYTARAARTNPLDSFEAAYYPIEGAPSDWQAFDLGPDWEEYSYEFTPPITNRPANVDLVALFPGAAGEQKQLDVSALRIDVLSPAVPD